MVPSSVCFLRQESGTTLPFLCYYSGIATLTKRLGSQIPSRGDGHVIWKLRICSGDPDLPPYPPHGRHAGLCTPDAPQSGPCSSRRTPRNPGLGSPAGADSGPRPGGPRHPHPDCPLRHPRRVCLALHRHPASPRQTHLTDRPLGHRPAGRPGHAPGSGAGLAATSQPLPPRVGLVRGEELYESPGIRKQQLWVPRTLYVSPGTWKERENNRYSPECIGVSLSSPRVPRYVSVGI